MDSPGSFPWAAAHFFFAGGFLICSSRWALYNSYSQIIEMIVDLVARRLQHIWAALGLLVFLWQNDFPGLDDWLGVSTWTCKAHVLTLLD